MHAAEDAGARNALVANAVVVFGAVSAVVASVSAGDLAVVEGWAKSGYHATSCSARFM